MVALAAVFVRDVVARTAGRLVAEARQQCGSACAELGLQYDERAAFVAGDPLLSLPAVARDLSLRGLSATVLRSYEGIAGGFYFPVTDEVLGYSGGPPELSAPARALLRRVAARALPAGQAVTESEQWENDMAVLAVQRTASPEAVAWTLKRIPGVTDPMVSRRRWLLIALAVSALLGLGGMVSIWYSLQSGLTAVKAGLRNMESDFQYQLPAIRGDFGQVAEAINTMTSRRFALETELRRQERLAALGKAVAGVAHEIRNPLNSMKLTLELLKRRMGKGMASATEVNAALAEVDRLDRIVARLLAFGRPALTNRHVQPLRPLLDQAAAMVSEQARARRTAIEIQDSNAAGLAADVDGPQIQQVVINLLLNAIDASPPGSPVTLRLDRRDGAALVTVADRGCGIPAEARARVFDIYFTTKPDGVGLGLAVSREIAAIHGGRLDFESEPGRTVFTLSLPLERNASETESVSAGRRG